MATTKAVATNCGINLALSAIPPEIIAGIAAAKVKRKKKAPELAPLRLTHQLRELIYLPKNSHRNVQPV